jgi:hypothetical protein
VTSNGIKLRSNLKNCSDLVEKHLKYSCVVIHSKSKVIKDNVKRSIHSRLSQGRRRYGVL